MRHLFFCVTLLVAFVVWSLIDGRESEVHVVTGTVVEWQRGQLIAVANEQTDRGGVRIDVRAIEHHEDRGAIRTGARVAVSYRSVGERYPVAISVQVLDPP